MTNANRLSHVNDLISFDHCSGRAVIHSADLAYLLGWDLRSVHHVIGQVVEANDWDADDRDLPIQRVALKRAGRYAFVLGQFGLEELLEADQFYNWPESAAIFKAVFRRMAEIERSAQARQEQRRATKPRTRFNPYAHPQW